MVCGDTPTSPEIIVANTLNFKPNFKFSRLKFFWRPPSQLGCALGSLGQSLARVKISGGCTPWWQRYNLHRKIHLSGWMLANKTFLFVDQSSPNFFPGTRAESLSITFLSHFKYPVSFRRYSRSKSKVVKNRAEFWTFFWPSQILGAAVQKLYPCYDPCPVARRTENVLLGYSH